MTLSTNLTLLTLDWTQAYVINVTRTGMGTASATYCYQSKSNRHNGPVDRGGI